MTSYENSLKLNKRLLNSKKILEIFKQNKLILNLECLSLKNVTMTMVILYLNTII